MMRLPEPWRRWYTGLSRRDRGLVIGGAGVVLALILYLALVQPLHSAYVHLVQRVQGQRTTLQWLNKKTARIRALEGNGPQVMPRPGGSTSVFSVVSASVQDSPIASTVQQLQQAGNGTIQLTLQGAPFDQLVQWLADLARTEGIIVVNASIERTTAPGRINATLSLKATR